MFNKILSINNCFRAVVFNVLLLVALINSHSIMALAESEHVPIFGDLEISNSIINVEHINTSSINNPNLSEKGVMIWTPDISDMPDDLECHAMLDNNTGKLSILLSGSNDSLNSYLMPSVEGMRPDDLKSIELMIHAQLYTRLYKLLENESLKLRLNLSGDPLYRSTESHNFIVVTKICIGSICINTSTNILSFIKKVPIIPWPHLSILNLAPNNTNLSSENVSFTWQTILTSNSSIKINNKDRTQDRNATPTQDHLIKLNATLEENKCYSYEATSSTPYESATRVGSFCINETKVPVFLGKPISFDINRDYNQTCTLRIKNKDSKTHNVTANVSSPYSDLILGFLETGTANNSICLNASEEKKLNLTIHAQDAMQKEYNLIARLYDRDDARLYDEAPVTVRIDFVPNFTIREIANDSLTLVKTIRIDNRGDTLTDLQVRSDPESRIYLHPRLNHFNLKSGEHKDFYAIPLFSENATSISGNITAQAGGRNETLHVVFECRDGNRIYKANLSYPQITIVKEDWYCYNRNNVSMPFLMPPGFDALDVRSAKMQIDFSLPSPRFWYLPHNVTILLNDETMDKMVSVIPEGTYTYNLSAANFNYANPENGNLGYNEIRLNTEHLNPAHYIVSGKVTIRLCLRILERWVCAPSRQAAEEILWRTPGINPVPENLAVNIISPQDGTNETLNNSFDIKASVNGSNGGLIGPRSNLEVFAESEDGQNVTLVDDGKDDGIYEGTLYAKRLGRVNITVKALNCLNSGRDNAWIYVKNITIGPDLVVSGMDTLKSTSRPGEIKINVTVFNKGNGTDLPFIVNLSVVDKTREIIGLAAGSSKTVNWTLNENELCGKVIQACADSENNVFEQDETNNCLQDCYCTICNQTTPSDLIISKLSDKVVPANEPITIDFGVKNIGNKETTRPFEVELRIDGNNIQNIQMEGLAGNQTKEDNFRNLSGVKEGIYPITICIDTTNVVTESKEGNNCRSANLTVIPPGNIIIINSNGPELFNYPVSVQMPIEGSSSLRFLDEQNNDLYYWVEKGSEIDSKVMVWINVTRIHPGKTIINVSQGFNPSTYQDPKKVFRFFDDFQTFDSSQWNYETIGGGALIPDADGVKFTASRSLDSQVFLQSRKSFFPGTALMFRVNLGSGQSRVTKAMGFINDHNARISPSLSWVANGRDISYNSDYGMRTALINFVPGYRIFEIRWQDKDVFFVIDGKVYGPNNLNSIDPTMPIEFILQSEITRDNSEMTLDWVAIRDYLSSDLKTELRMS